jgi:hypothetical protein
MDENGKSAEDNQVPPIAVGSDSEKMELRPRVALVLLISISDLGSRVF